MSSPDGKPEDVVNPDGPIVVTSPPLADGVPPGPPILTSGCCTPPPAGRSRPNSVGADALSWASPTRFGGPGVGSPDTIAGEVSLGPTRPPVSGLRRKLVSSPATTRSRSARGLKSMSYCDVPCVDTGLLN